MIVIFTDCYIHIAPRSTLTALAIKVDLDAIKMIVTSTNNLVFPLCIDLLVAQQSTVVKLPLRSL